jgi:hypothetical protein
MRADPWAMQRFRGDHDPRARVPVTTPESVTVPENLSGMKAAFISSDRAARMGGRLGIYRDSALCGCCGLNRTAEASRDI